MKYLLLLAAGPALAACQPKAQEPANDAAAPRAAAAPAAEQMHPVSGLPLAPLEIRSGGKTHRFTVEIARSESEQAYGLMNRTALGDSEGMLFPFSPPKPASFWMKNTLIPLDIIFIRDDGTIARIEANTVPLSEDPVPSGEPIVLVLELAGGRAAELGIAEGDKVEWPR
jgi:hypothetical protein